MKYLEEKKLWQNLYAESENQLAKMATVKSVITAFNANIDSVVKITGEEIINLAALTKTDIGAAIAGKGERNITTPEDVVRGIIKCFASGNAEEWLADDEEPFLWIKQQFGYQKLQMGGQGGIVANALGICGVNKVYAHAASLPKEQASLFLAIDNIVSANQNGEEQKASEIKRNDVPMVHWIFEFNKGDGFTFDGKTIICPKSNRFIATYDPLNFELYIDENFSDLVNSVNHDYIILSGYHMLKARLNDGRRGIDQIENSFKHLKKWCGEKTVLHLEAASTSDLEIRKYIADNLLKRVDSVGLNDRETIDLLEVMGETELVELCNKKPNAENLFKAIYKIFDISGYPRVQLHMFGLYITIQRKGFKITPEANRRGMMLAAFVAAAKAGTGTIDIRENLLWAKGKPLSDISFEELSRLALFVEKSFGKNELMTTGIYCDDRVEIIAIPSIIVEKPLTLVGMGDTISSISLVGAV